MPRARTSKAMRGQQGPIMHWAARMEDRFHRFRLRRGRRRGLVTTVIPYTAYGRTANDRPGWVRVLCRVVLTRPDAADTERYRKVRGWRAFFSIPVGDTPVIVDIDGVEVELLADRGGVIDARLESTLQAGWQQLTIRTNDTEPVVAPVYVVDDQARLGILSDVDDTVMVTALPRPLLAAWNAFVVHEHARRAVTGMPVLYDRLAQAHPEAPFIYLSTGAWNVAPALGRFLDRNMYPPGPLLLTDWGPTHDRWFRSGRAHKQKNLERLAEEFPDLKWLLIGDDGQHDESLYSDFAEQHPDAVAAIAIRRLSPSEAVLAGGRHKSEPRDDRAPWIWAPDGAGLADHLEELGILPATPN
ncbi:App1 family protein [Ruicaihuangia caeni]|uniref:DUF2183 domain-containing protein n=1 Tax=Ruicaihuangia caeni TaxID=3042517 RepID=A0AAW6T262_9MICO|nr:phosphatase domain-containing protein [Klugiella sp. YN-L-19]MDI2097910.1 DUF2183 domain-containing protein [Klugiella sp. YN-L-19]